MAITEFRTMINLPKELKKLVDQSAKKKRLSRSALIRLALSEWLEQQGLKEKLEEDVAKRKK